MTKKDYIVIASVLRAYSSFDIIMLGLLPDLCIALKSDNPRFDDTKFVNYIKGVKNG